MPARQRGLPPSHALSFSTCITWLAFAWLLVGVAACSDDTSHPTHDRDASMSDEDEDAATHTPLPDDVDAVLEARCRECHARPTRNFAPFPLVRWEDTQGQAPGYERGIRIYEVMQMRIHDGDFPMPPGDREMTDADRKVIDAWIASGAQAGH